MAKKVRISALLQILQFIKTLDMTGSLDEAQKNEIEKALDKLKKKLDKDRLRKKFKMLAGDIQTASERNKSNNPF